MSRVDKQFETLLDYGKVENSKFYQPFGVLLGDSDPVIEIQEEAKRVIHHEVKPAFEKLRGDQSFDIKLMPTAIYFSDL